MSHETVLQLTKEDGSVVQRRMPHAKSTLTVRFFSFLVPRGLTRPLASLQLFNQRLIAISDNIAELTRVTELSVSSRFFFVLR